MYIHAAMIFEEEVIYSFIWDRDMRELEDRKDLDTLFI